MWWMDVPPTILVLGVMAVLCLGLIRVLLILPGRRVRRAKTKRQRRKYPATTVIVLGSGGHTAEMFKLLSGLDCTKRYLPRHYFVSKTDHHSISKLNQFEKAGRFGSNEKSVHTIPRSREVGQSFVTAVFTTLWSMLYAIPIVLYQRPELILCNGPGTCVPICAAGMVLKFFCYPTKIIYIESLARVQSLSLSGKILYHFADRFLVQWPQLEAKYSRAEFVGRLL